MFDVGFLELTVIMVLGLLVLGPERLPKTAQKIGYWFGKARRYVEGMKEQVEAEFDTSEVKRLLHNQEVQIRELQTKITESGESIGNEFNTNLQNNFDDDDPGSSHDEAAQANVSEKPSGPQYDIIEDDSWEEDDTQEDQSSVSKPPIDVPAEVSEKSESAEENTVSNKA